MYKYDTLTEQVDGQILVTFYYRDTYVSAGTANVTIDSVADDHAVCWIAAPGPGITAEDAQEAVSECLADGTIDMQ